MSCFTREDVYANVDSYDEDYIVFSVPGCKKCQNAIKYLSDRDACFRVVNVKKDQEDAVMGAYRCYHFPIIVDPNGKAVKIKGLDCGSYCWYDEDDCDKVV
jgi:glutaredoxin